MILCQSRTEPMVRKSPLPPYLCWRDGRPRWNPGPELRSRGYKGRDLKTPDDRWMDLSQAVAAAVELNSQVARQEPLQAPAKAHTLAELFAAFKGTADKPSAAWKRLKPRTQKDYTQEMAILEGLMGDVPVAAIRRVDIEELYQALKETKGPARANAIVRVLRLTLNHAIHSLEWPELKTNRAGKLKLQPTAGRLVMWTRDEIRALVACADWLTVTWTDGTTREYQSVGDAVILGLCTGQNRADVLTAPPFVPENDVYRMRRGKTGRECFIPRSKLLDDRIAEMRARRLASWPNVAFGTELVCTALGHAYPADGDYFQHEFGRVRLIASGAIFALEDICRALGGLPPLLRNLPFTPTPSILDKNFQDLRDTAVTVLYALLKDISRVATITGHSLKTAQEIIDKHYFVRQADMVRDAGAAFDDYLAKGRIGG